LARVLLYGATGFSGRALAEALVGRGVPLVLGGRDPARLEAVGRALGCAVGVASLEDDHALRDLFSGVRLVVNCAGPFRHSATAMMAAAIAVGADYTDLAGEWPVFVAAERLDGAAREAGTMLLPGIGFTVAATDCLLAETAAAAERPVRLRLAVSVPQIMSGGSVATALGLADLPVIARREGALEAIAPATARAFDFGDGPVDAVPVSWPDVVTAPHTTGVGTIEAFSEIDPRLRLWWRAGAGGRVRPELARGLSRLARYLPEGPATGPGGGFTLVAEAEDRWRRVSTRRYRTPDGYTATTRLAAGAVARIRAGARAPGFQTPAGLFGAGFAVACGAAQRCSTESERALA
jgi:saccharopine dehydrogenase (NAD+, L-lysine-forming)